MTYDALAGMLRLSPSGAGKSILDSSLAIPPGVKLPEACGVEALFGVPGCSDMSALWSCGDDDEEEET